MKFPKDVEQLIDPPIGSLIKLAREHLNSDQAVLNLNQAVPSYLPPDGLLEKAAKSSEPYHLYSNSKGIYAIRESIAKSYQSLYSYPPNASSILFTAGANNAFFTVITSITAPDDEVILFTPYYFNHYMTLEGLGRKTRQVPLDADNGYRVPFEKLKDSITSKTRAIVFINPGNPTGVSHSQEELDELISIAKQHKLFLISDEVYNYFHTDYPKPASVLNHPRADHLISIHSFSKSLAMTGYRVGMVIASDNVMRQLLKTHDSNLICAPVIGQIMASIGLSEYTNWIESHAEKMRSNASQFLKLVDQSKTLTLSDNGCYFSFVRTDVRITNERQIRALREHNMLFLTGEHFGNGWENYLRLAMGNIDPKEYGKVIEKLEAIQKA